MRDFEKISFKQFVKDIKNDIRLYNDIKIPQRDSDYTAGYDIYLLEDIKLEKNEIKKIPTGLKCYFGKDEVLLLVVRSSMGFKYNIRLCNQVGVIDADYYNNEDNEGHIWLRVQNEGDKTIEFKKGKAIAQGIFMKYLTTNSNNTLKLKRKSTY
ncbi:MAG: hypothetical protein IJK18_00125 [Clostridia bacterium]|nr:hypothetical protein [Clostridia bacterium]